MIWVETRLIEPPEHTVSGRFGGSVMFVGYFKWLNEWRWLQPGGIEERIAEPEMIFVDEEWVRDHTLKQPRAMRESKNIHRSKSAEQFLLGL